MTNDDSWHDVENDTHGWFYRYRDYQDVRLFRPKKKMPIAGFEPWTQIKREFLEMTIAGIEPGPCRWQTNALTIPAVVISHRVGSKRVCVGIYSKP
jgi:hypothetical protein